MRRILALYSSLALTATVTAAEFYVAPKGDDTNPGTREKPLATMEKARDAARANPGADTILVHGGTYWMETPLVLTPADSGITIKAVTCEKPVLSGGQRITGWQPLPDNTLGVANAAKGKIWVADIPKGWLFHYLFVDGQPQPRAKLHNTHWRRWATNFSFSPPSPNGQVVTFKDKAILQNIPGNGDVEMVCLMAQFGVIGNGTLTQVNPEAGTATWNSTQTFLGWGKRRPYYFTLENALPFIDQPGEWAVDSAAGKVYCWPATGDLTKADVIGAKAYRLLEFQGDTAAQKWVENVTVQGLTLAFTDRLPEDQWPPEWIRRQWEHMDATVYFQGAKDCILSGNRILHSGSTGIMLNQFCQGIRIEGNEVGWPGSSGIYLCGYGPGTLDVNRENSITRNWVHDTGQGNYWHSNAIQIYQSGHNQVTQNLLQNSAYSCISIVGVPISTSRPAEFIKDHPDNRKGQYAPWSQYGILFGDFPKNMQELIRAGKFHFTRDTLKTYAHSRANLIENNIVVEPEQLLDEGGAIYAYCAGKGNIWKDNLVFKSAGMPGSSILALDDIAEYFTVTGNVIWVNGRAACGTIGMRPNERGNVIHDNIRACYKPEHADGGGGNASGIKKKFYTTDTTREPAYKLEKTILDKVNAAGGWPGNPATGIPRPGDEVKPMDKRVKVKLEHVTIE